MHMCVVLNTSREWLLDCNAAQETVYFVQCPIYFSNSREQKPRAVHSIIGCYGNTGKQWRVQQKKHLGRSDQTGTDVCIQQGRLRLSGELFLRVHDSFFFPFAQAS